MDAAALARLARDQIKARGCRPAAPLMGPAKESARLLGDAKLVTLDSFTFRIEAPGLRVFFDGRHEGNPVTFSQGGEAELRALVGRLPGMTAPDAEERAKEAAARTAMVAGIDAGAAEIVLQSRALVEAAASAKGMTPEQYRAERAAREAEAMRRRGWGAWFGA